MNSHPKFQKYYATDNGEVFRIKGNRPLKAYPDKYGYFSIMLRLNKKTHKVRLNRFVYECFKGLIPNGYVIDHIDNDSGNDSISNLQMVTQQNNIIKKFERGYKIQNKKKGVEAENVDTNIKEVFKSIYRAGKTINICSPSVRRCCEHQQRTAIQRGTGIHYKFSYIN